LFPRSILCRLIPRSVLLFRTVSMSHSCNVSKYLYLSFQLDPQAKAQLVADKDLYYDKSYTVAYSTFANIRNGNCWCDPRTLFSYAN
jgi:hypothetical protein